MQPALATSSSSSSAAPSSWQERIAGGRITTAPPAFSKDGDFLITCALSVLKVYSIKTGELVKTLRHKTHVTGYFFNPDNALQLYSVAHDGIIRLWDFEDGVLLKSWKIGGEGTINHAALDAHHRVVYLGIEKSKTSHHISTFNLQNHTSRLRYSSNVPIYRLYVSPRGDFFAVIFQDRLGFHLFDVKSLSKQVIKHNRRIMTFDFHPTEPCVAYADDGGMIRVNYCLPSVDTDTTMTEAGEQAPKSVRPPVRARIDKYEWHTVRVAALKFSPDGFYMLSGGKEEVLVLWRLGTKTKIFIPRMGAPIASVVLNEQGTAYAVCCKDNSIRIIDARSRDLLIRIQGISLETRKLPITIEPHNGLITTCFDSGSLQFYDPVRDRHVDQMEIVANPQVFFDDAMNLPMGVVTHVAHGPKGSFMVTADYRATTDIDPEINIKFWKHDGNRYTLNSVAHEAHQEEVKALACHPILPLVASCSTDGKFKIWEQIEKEAPPGSKQKDVVRTMWVCRSVGDFKGLPASTLSFSTDGSLLAVAYGSTITLWDPMSSTFQRSLTFTNGMNETIKHLSFVPSSRYLVSATAKQMFVWDLLRCAVVWSYTLSVQSLVVDPSVNYKANLVFPSPSSLVSSFVVTDGAHIYLFNPASPKPLHVWKVDHRIVALAFAATSSLLPEGRIVYLTKQSQLVSLEKKIDKKITKKTDQEKVSLSMSKVKNAKREVKEEKLSAFESAFGKLSLAKDQADAAQPKGPVRAEDVGVPVPREDTSALFNPIAPQLSHLFNGPSHLLPSPSKIYSSFMEGLLKKVHTQVTTASEAAAAGAEAEASGESAMQLEEAPAPDKEQTTMETTSDDANTSKNQQKRQSKATEKMFYDSMFKFFSSYAARDGEEAEMPPSLLNELTAPVQPSKAKKAKNQGQKNAAKSHQKNAGGNNKQDGKRQPKKTQQNGVEHAKADTAKTTTTPAEPSPEPKQAEPTAALTKSQRKRRRAEKGAAKEDQVMDAMAVEVSDDKASGPREEPLQAKSTNSAKQTDPKAPRRRRKSAATVENGPQE